MPIRKQAHSTSSTRSAQSSSCPSPFSSARPLLRRVPLISSLLPRAFILKITDQDHLRANVDAQAKLRAEGGPDLSAEQIVPHAGVHADAHVLQEDLANLVAPPFLCPPPPAPPPQVRHYLDVGHAVERRRNLFFCVYGKTGKTKEKNKDMSNRSKHMSPSFTAVGANVRHLQRQRKRPETTAATSQECGADSCLSARRYLRVPHVIRILPNLLRRGNTNGRESLRGIT